MAKGYTLPAIIRTGERVYGGILTEFVHDGCYESVRVQLDNRVWHSISGDTADMKRLETSTGQRVEITYRTITEAPDSRGVSAVRTSGPGTAKVVPPTDDEIMAALTRGIDSGNWVVFDGN